MKKYDYTLIPALTIASPPDAIVLVACYEDGKWRETFVRFTMIEAQSAGNIWIAEQEEFDAVAFPTDEGVKHHRAHEDKLDAEFCEEETGGRDRRKDGADGGFNQ